MTITESIQSLEPGSLITLYELDATSLGAGVLRFHAHLQQGPIYWKGAPYSPWPVKAEGFALTSDRPPQPTLTVANVDRSITILCATFEDLVGAKLTSRRTLVQFLDAENFPGGNPTADPSEHLPDEIWFIEQKSAETYEAVEFRLSSAMDFNGVRLPRRQIISNQCPWQYRSPECSYAGPPVAKDDDTPTSDPAEDRCGKRMQSCRLRFGENGQLPFGGFPAASLGRM